MNNITIQYSNINAKIIKTYDSNNNPIYTCNPNAIIISFNNYINTSNTADIITFRYPTSAIPTESGITIPNRLLTTTQLTIPLNQNINGFYTLIFS